MRIIDFVWNCQINSLKKQAIKLSWYFSLFANGKIKFEKEMIEILLLILGQIATANIDIAFDNTTVIINETNSH